MKTHQNNEPSQKQKVLNAMLSGRKLTCLDGWKFGCLNLRNRICEIAREGKYKITKGWKRTKTNKYVRVYSIDI